MAFTRGKIAGSRLCDSVDIFPINLGIVYVHNYDYAKVIYKFALPIKVKIYEEYLITDVITLIGSVGGTLSLFIGFSIINIVNNIMDFIKSIIESYFSRK